MEETKKPAKRQTDQRRKRTSQKKQSKGQADVRYLNNLREHCTNIEVFLVTGARLKGKIVAFSPYAIILESQNRELLINKSAIISIRPEAEIYILNPKKPKDKPQQKKD